MSRQPLQPGDATAPWIPADLYYPAGPKTCPCGHHEGYHAHSGACLFHRKCKCEGLPPECFTPPPPLPTPGQIARHGRLTSRLAG
jgi:hypothetical protein